MFVVSSLNHLAVSLAPDVFGDKVLPNIAQADLEFVVILLP